MLRSAAVAGLLPLVLLSAAACSGSDDSDNAGNSGNGDSTSGSVDTTARLVSGELELVMTDLQLFAQTAGWNKEETGSYPASKTDGLLSDQIYDSEGEVTYTPNDDRSEYTACIQARDNGPWATYDSAQGGYLSLGEDGSCSFDAPEAGGVTEVQRDLLRVREIYEGIQGDGCDALPDTRKLLADGVLSEGNRVECSEKTLQEDQFVIEIYCVQHGDDGAWASYDSLSATSFADGGECALDVDSAAR